MINGLWPFLTKNVIIKAAPSFFIVRKSYKSVPDLQYKKSGPSVLREIEEQFKDQLKKDLILSSEFTSEQWDEFANKLLNNSFKSIKSHVNAKNVDGVILRFCAELGLAAVGLAYFNHLKQKNKILNAGILSRYLSICAMDRKYALEHEDEIIHIYKVLRTSPILESSVGERCIAAICLFEKHWRDSFQLLEKIKTITQPTPSSYCAIAEACFRFGNLNEGWEMLREMVLNCHAKPKPSVYIALIERFESLKQTGEFHLEYLEDMFKFLEEFHLKIPDLAVVEKLDKFIFSLSDKEMEWSLKETFIPKNAACSSCRRVLEPVIISSRDFQQLSRHFVQKVVVGNNIFLKTTPEEIEKFKSFLVKSHPYDIVIDGLNVAYSKGNKSPTTLAKALKAVVEHFLRKNKKIIVLGRKHMLHWPKETMEFILKNTRTFFAMNLSQDDPFLLYAALRGGEHTFFISRDFMRSHLFALEDQHLKLLFWKWLVSHQFTVSHYSQFGVPNIVPPLPYRPTAQKLLLNEPELCWHLPYDEEYQMLPPTKREPPPKWLCIRRRLRNC